MFDPGHIANRFGKHLKGAIGGGRAHRHQGLRAKAKRLIQPLDHPKTQPASTKLSGRKAPGKPRARQGIKIANLVQAKPAQQDHRLRGKTQGFGRQISQGLARAAFRGQALIFAKPCQGPGCAQRIGQGRAGGNTSLGQPGF